MVGVTPFILPTRKCKLRYGLQQVWRVDLVACGILFLRPGIEPTSPALQGRFLITGPPREVPTFDSNKLKTELPYDPGIPLSDIN